jgi:hypothetical protein
VGIRGNLIGLPVAAAFGVAGQLTAIGPAHADNVGTIDGVPPQTGVGTAGFPYSCFGHLGTFKDGSRVLIVDWDGNGTGDECFAIAPNRTIWHAWPASGGWREMPNGGRADDTSLAFVRAGLRTIQVWVASPASFYCSSLGSAGWQAWVRC